MGSVTDIILTHEPTLRVGAFIGGVVLFGGLETFISRQKTRPDRLRRWLVNYSLTLINVGLLRLVFPILAAGVAAKATDQAWGVLNQASISPLLSGLLGILALDFLIYWQHRLFHRVPVLWRLHRMHHSDTAMDVSTALRFHPLEIVLSMAIKMAAVVALGIPPYAVIIFETLLNVSAMFNHANWDIGSRAERLLSRIIVTPDLHRIHHSVRVDEMHTNFGFFLSIWDRFFHSRRSASHEAQDSMAIGLAAWRGGETKSLERLLMQPLERDVS